MMKIRFNLAVASLVLMSAVLSFAATKTELAEKAVSTDAAASSAAIKNLRALGQEGFDALREKYAAEIARFSETGEATSEWRRIAFALDSVAMQKDAFSSNLYWFTDFEEARREAAKTNKPILSLRLLGNLNEEFSCANSRFFRALLYSNAEISKFLRANYILHWQSMRPAPKVTIDFGDGRRIERTLTGNSIHYLLDKNGEILDALPGLYSPQAFLKNLERVTRLVEKTDALNDGEKQKAVLLFRRDIFEDIKEKREAAIAKAKVKLTEPKDGTGALEVAPRAVTKMMTEASILRDLNDDFARFEPQINLDDWRKLSAIYAAETRLDAASLAFIKRQNRQTGLTETQFARLAANLEALVALDTTRNDFLFHTKLCEWLNQPRAKSLALKSFNSRVYAELFKTPDSDKWLGLYSTDVYTALDGNGIVK